MGATFVGMPAFPEAARTALSSWSMVRGPMMGAVTTGLWSSHANATSPGGWPISRPPGGSPGGHRSPSSASTASATRCPSRRCPRIALPKVVPSSMTETWSQRIMECF